MSDRAGSARADQVPGGVSTDGLCSGVLHADATRDESRDGGRLSSSPPSFGVSLNWRALERESDELRETEVDLIDDDRFTVGGGTGGSICRVTAQQVSRWG